MCDTFTVRALFCLSVIIAELNSISGSESLRIRNGGMFTNKYEKKRSADSQIDQNSPSVPSTSVMSQTGSRSRELKEGSPINQIAILGPVNGSPFSSVTGMINENNIINQLSSISNMSGMMNGSNLMNQLGSIGNMTGMMNSSNPMNQLGSLDNMSGMMNASNLMNQVGSLDNMSGMMNASNLMNQVGSLDNMSGMMNASNLMNQVGSLDNMSGVMNGNNPMNQLATQIISVGDNNPINQVTNANQKNITQKGLIADESPN